MSRRSAHFTTAKGGVRTERIFWWGSAIRRFRTSRQRFHNVVAEVGRDPRVIINRAAGIAFQRVSDLSRDHVAPWKKSSGCTLRQIFPHFKIS